MAKQKSKKGVGSYIIEFPLIRQERGNLLFGEIERHVPFAIKRYFVILDTPPNTKRGEHAHKKTQQVLKCIRGSIKLHLDNGSTKEEIVLSEPHKGVYIGPMVWHEMTEFAPGTILLVLASDFYDESDYIRNYNDFIQRLQKGV